MIFYKNEGNKEKSHSNDKIPKHDNHPVSNEEHKTSDTEDHDMRKS
jgi:hypothetical protein